MWSVTWNIYKSVVEKIVTVAGVACCESHYRKNRKCTERSQIDIILEVNINILL